MVKPANIRKWLEAAMRETGLSVAQLANLSGVHKATIFRALNEDYEFVPSSRTLDRLTTALVDAGVDQQLTAVLTSPDRSHDQMPVRDEIGVGIWNERETT